MPEGRSERSVLRVRTSDGRVFRFSQAFHIGRDVECDVQIQDVHVSRRHLSVSFANGQWSLHDLQSSNGVFVDGQRVETASIDKGLTIRLGVDGPTLTLDQQSPVRTEPLAVPSAGASSGDTMILAGYAERYFGPAANDEGVGGRTLMIRKAFVEVQKKQKR
jgi:membrane-bound lytic murein transglycosylase D